MAKVTTVKIDVYDFKLAMSTYFSQCLRCRLWSDVEGCKHPDADNPLPSIVLCEVQDPT